MFEITCKPTSGAAGLGRRNPITRRVREIVCLAAAAVLFLAITAPCHAGVIFQTGNHPQPNEENILFGAPQTGTTITGHTQTSNILVNFSSTTDVLKQVARGQADIFAVDGSVNNLTVSIPNGTFTDLIMNPQTGSGTATVTVVANDGTFTFQYELGRGQNFLTITTSGGETISSVTVDAPGGFDDFKQPRISGASVARVVPEPASLTLLGLGGIGLLGFAWRRLRPSA